ncbi:MAG: JAB domain-containing protein [Opitutaceae bacterium]|jgi:DNA repair protein RadC
MKIKEAYIAYRQTSQECPDTAVNNPRMVVELMKPVIEKRPDQEQLWVLLVDVRLRLLGRVCCFIGTLDSVTMHPREIVRYAMLANAHGVVLVHNHPSGDPSPSVQDTATTAAVEQALKLVGVALLDHVVIGSAERDPKGHGYCSLLGDL